MVQHDELAGQVVGQHLTVVVIGAVMLKTPLVGLRLAEGRADILVAPAGVDVAVHGLGQPLGAGAAEPDHR